MLYKKVHRQYLREWRVGRRFKYKNEYGESIYKITRKPYIDGYHIWVDYSDYYYVSADLDLIRWTGLMWYKDKITLLED